MKQIDECLDRYFEGKPYLKSKKWKALAHPKHPQVLLLYHYQHLILMADLHTGQVHKAWWETWADKRGLDAAFVYLQKKLTQGAKPQ